MDAHVETADVVVGNHRVRNSERCDAIATAEERGRGVEDLKNQSMKWVQSIFILEPRRMLHKAPDGAGMQPTSQIKMFGAILVGRGVVLQTLQFVTFRWWDGAVMDAKERACEHIMAAQLQSAWATFPISYRHVYGWKGAPGH